MSKQPEALRLADELGAEIERTVQVDMLHHNAAAELRLLPTRQFLGPNAKLTGPQRPEQEQAT